MILFYLSVFVQSLGTDTFVMMTKWMIVMDVYFNQKPVEKFTFMSEWLSLPHRFWFWLYIANCGKSVFFLCFRCMVKVTGDITVSFPASVLPLLYDTENAPLLSFLVRGTSCLEQILPNKALINRYWKLRILILRYVQGAFKKTN